MRLVFVKRRVLVSDAAHFAGGIHYFTCLLTKCAAYGHAIHCCSTAPKGLVLQHLAKAGLLHALTSIGPSSSQVTWEQDGIRHTVVLTYAAGQDAPALLAAAVAAAAAPASVGGIVQQVHPTQPRPPSPPQPHLVIFDADEASLWDIQASSSAGAHSRTTPTTTTTTQPCSFLSRLLAVAGAGRCLAVVQNLYHLPWGPYACCSDANSTSRHPPQQPDHPQLAAAWRLVSGYICVSQYVQQYVTRHAPSLPGSPPPAAVTCVVPPTAVGACGAGPWTDYTHLHTHQLFRRGVEQQQAMAAASNAAEAATTLTEQSGVPTSSSSSALVARPTVGLLKCSPEKGSDLFSALASRLPTVNFLAVCGDPAVTQQMAALRLPNLQLVDPVSNVGQLLQQVHVVVVPSVLHEAFGMVVVDAMLHGVPVLVSNTGAPAEAACGAAAAVVPMPQVTFPPQPLENEVVAAAAAAAAVVGGCCSQGSSKHSPAPAAAAVGVPAEVGAAGAIRRGAAAGAAGARLADDRRWRWHAKQLPSIQPHHVDAWVHPLQQLLSSPAGYTHACSAARRAALHCVGVAATEQWGVFVAWLQDRAAQAPAVL